MPRYNNIKVVIEFDRYFEEGGGSGKTEFEIKNPDEDDPLLCIALAKNNEKKRANGEGPTQIELF